MLATDALANIRIVLIQTYHPGNIGAAARAMKTMGLTQLVLVNPCDFPHEDATALSAGANDVLEQARVVDSLQAAIADCSLVIGTSARDRSLSLPPLLPEQCADKLLEESVNGPVAVVFGRERMGLLNEEIQQCHFQVNIPANPDYPVLNIASAIQILCYEMYRSLNRQSLTPDNGTADDYPLVDDLNQFYDHLDSTLNSIGFIKARHPGQTMPRLQRLFRRARLEKKELQILRGILSRVDQIQKPD